MTKENLDKFIEENQQEVDSLYNTLKDGNVTDVIKCLLEEPVNNLFASSKIPSKDVIAFHLDVAMEECGELVQSISKCHRAFITHNYTNTEEITYGLNEEMADVLMNIYRIIILLGLKEEDIYKILAAKIIRYRKYSEKCIEEGKL